MRKKKNQPAKVSTKSGAPTSPMDLGLLQQIVEMMDRGDLNTVDLRDGDKRVILKRGQPLVAYTPAAAVPTASSSPASAAPTAPAAAPAEDANLVPIKSPMVGTFYSKPSPDAKAFVTVGSRVDEETDVCIIEAMKVFNNIKAETRGTIAKSLVADGQTVEFGTVLYLVKPN